jgi:hypothetical protein
VGWSESVTVAEPTVESAAGATTWRPAPYASPLGGDAAGDTGVSGDDPVAYDDDGFDPLTADAATLDGTNDDTPIDPVGGADASVGEDEEVYWSAEVGEIGEPDDVPEHDTPMGSAFQLGVAALLGDPDGSVLGVPTSNNLSEPPSFEKVTRTTMWQAPDEADTTSADVPTADAVETSTTEFVESDVDDGATTTEPAAVEPITGETEISTPTDWMASAAAVVETTIAPTSQPMIPPTIDPLMPPTGEATAAPASATSSDDWSVPPEGSVQMPDHLRRSTWSPLPRRDEVNAAKAEETAAPVEPVAPPAPAPEPTVTATELGLPKREPRKPSSPTQELVGDKLVTTPRRPAEEIRSILSSYRSGLTSGRDGDDAATTPNTSAPQDSNE